MTGIRRSSRPGGITIIIPAGIKIITTITSKGIITARRKTVIVSPNITIAAAAGNNNGIFSGHHKEDPANWRGLLFGAGHRVIRQHIYVWIERQFFGFCGKGELDPGPCILYIDGMGFAVYDIFQREFKKSRGGLCEIYDDLFFIRVVFPFYPEVGMAGG